MSTRSGAKPGAQTEIASPTKLAIAKVNARLFDGWTNANDPKKATAYMYRAWCIVTILKQSLVDCENDEVPFSACALEATLAQADEMFCNVHEHLESLTEEKAVI